MRAVGVVLMIIGALLGGTGGYALVQYVRSGDWVVGPTATANPGGEDVVVSQYGLLWYDSDIRVTATSGADFFMGTANPIDVDDYTGAVARSTITSLSWRAIGTSTTTADSRDPAVTPSECDFWLTHASGARAELVIAPGGEVPTQVVLVSKNGAPIALRVDYHVPGVRVVVFGVIGAGAGLALIGLVLLLFGIRRSRRKKQATSVPPLAPPSSSSGPSWPVALPPYPVRPYSGTQRTARRLAGLVAVALVASTAGCSLPAVPTTLNVPHVPRHTAVPPRAQLSMAPLTSEGTTTVSGDLQSRMAHAWWLGHAPAYSVDDWKTLYTDLVLQENIYDTTYAKTTKAGATSPCRNTIETVYGTAAKAYPMTSTVMVRWECGGNLALRVLTVLTKEHSSSHWFIAAESFAEAGVSMEPGYGERSSAEEQLGSKATTDLLGILNQKSNTTVTPTTDLTTFTRSCTEPTAGSIRTMSATILTPTDKQGTLRFAKTATGTVVTASYVVTCVVTARPGYYVYWPAPLDQVLGQPGDRNSLSRRFAVTVGVLIEGSTVTMVAFTADPIL